MVIAQELRFDYPKMEVKASLFADTQSEVSSTMEIEGMPDGYTLAAGSSVLTAAGEVAFLKSDKTWNWL